MYNTRGTTTTYVGAVFLDGARPVACRFVYNPDYVWPTGNLADGDKWRFLSSGTFDASTNVESDWSFLLAVGPMLLPPGGKAVMSYAIVAGQSLSDLQAAADAARQHFASYVTDAALAPRRLALRQNYPNPFNPATHIEFDLPDAAHARLAVYDVRGRLVTRLLEARLDPGRHRVVWDGRDAGGRTVSTGIYFYALEVEGHDRLVRKMAVLK